MASDGSWQPPELPPTESEGLRVQTGNFIFVGGLMIMGTIYMAWQALETGDISYAGAALLAAGVLGFCAAVIGSSDDCTVSIETMEACKDLLEVCEEDLAEKQRYLEDEEPRIVKYA